MQYLRLTPQIRVLIETGALFVINDSGGKDSQAMKIQLSLVIPKKQILVVHSHLPEVEWPGVKEHIMKYSKGLPVLFTQAKKTFFEMVDRRGKFPSPSTRQCTSDLKRDPIQVVINGYAKTHGYKVVVNCLGLRAEESSSRAKKEVFKVNKRATNSVKTQFEWLPIHDFKIQDVWDTIKIAGQEPHWAYSKGMSRLSCCFCIMASEEDIRTAAALMPELFLRYVQKERELNFTFTMPVKGKQRFLTDIVSSPCSKKAA